MGRIFTVDFWYEGREYRAFVQLTAAGDFFSVHIQLPDPSLHHLIPEGVITYNSNEGINSMHTHAEAPSFELVSRIVAAIDAHLKHR